MMPRQNCPISSKLAARFTLAEAKIAAAKVACLVAALKIGGTTSSFDSLRYAATTAASDLATATLNDPILQRLRNTNLEAFHYCWKAETYHR